MPNIEAIIREINKDLVLEFEKKLRMALAGQEKEWLIEQIVRLTLDAHSLEERDRKYYHKGEQQKIQVRTERIRKLSLDSNKLQEFIQRYKDYSREILVEETLLAKDAPAKGGDLITDAFRSAEGTELLRQIKDMLFGFLFGDKSTNTRLQRAQRQLLTLTLPRMKAGALDFMKATTELSARGRWQDPKSGSNELQTDNVLLEIEYGDTEDKMISNGIITALKLINNLEINEELLYGRIETVEQSTLVS